MTLMGCLKRLQLSQPIKMGGALARSGIRKTQIATLAVGVPTRENSMVTETEELVRGEVDSPHADQL